MKRRWKISQELCYEIQQYNFTLNYEPNFKELIKISKKFIDDNSSIKLQNGIIIKLDKSRNFGLIKTNNKNEDNIYFNFGNVIDKNVLHKGNKVVFEVIVNNRKLNEAINLRGE